MCRADGSGRVGLSFKEIQSVLGLSRQRYRTLLGQLISTAEITAEITANSTALNLGISTIKAKRATAKKTASATAEITTENAVVIPEESYPSWVEESFREVWKEWLRYRKEMHKEYKSDTSAKTGYERLVKMSNNNPEIAMAIVKQSIGNGYQGIFPVKDNNYDNGTNNPANQSSGRGQHRAPDALDLAREILGESARRESI